METREQLQRQLTDAWDILIQVDATLEDTVDALIAARKDIKRITKEHHDKTTVRGSVRVEPTSGVGAGSAAKAEFVSGMSLTNKQ